MDTEKIILDFTSSPFKKADGMKSLEACKKAAEQYGFQFGVQLHNTAQAFEVENLRNAGIKLSAHAPLVSKFSINLAAENFELAEELIIENYKLFKELDIDRTVFHGFGMTDKAIPMFGAGASYDECMQQVFRPELSLPDSRICCDFTESNEFKERQLRVKERLKYIRETYSDVLWCLENDFPAYGSANMLPESSIFIDNPVCLDSSHLWASAHIFDRNFHKETMKYLDSGLVKMVHVHASIFTPETPKGEWSDGHLPLGIANSMDLPRFIRACRDAGVEHYVLEIPSGDSDDIHAFAKMWNS